MNLIYYLTGSSEFARTKSNSENIQFYEFLTSRFLIRHDDFFFYFKEINVAISAMNTITTAIAEIIISPLFNE